MAVNTTSKQAPKKGKGSDYDDTNRGVLFINDKDGNGARPDYTGHALINPDVSEKDENGLLKVRLAAWVKDSSKVGSYLSIAISEFSNG